ncbi:MAG: DUF3080 family protein [Neptuniibacter sp.]
MKLKLLTHHLTTILIFLVSATLTGCGGDQPEAMMENYTSRLSRVLGVDSELPNRTEPPLFPLRRERLMQTTEIREGLFDVLKLKTCKLLPLIAERNSSLGKVYPPSQKMLYELKFYNTVLHCLNVVKADPGTDPEFLSQLNDIYLIKDQNLAAEIWNGVYTSSEVESNFSIGESPLPLSNDGSVASMLNAFSTLSDLGKLAKDRDEWLLPTYVYSIEPVYEQLYRNRSGAKILSSLTLVTQYLNYAATLIEDRLEKRPICFNGLVSEQGKILKNVFYKYYAGEFQPYMAYVHKSTKTWFDLNNHLIESLKVSGLVLPSAINDYHHRVLKTNSDDSLWSEYQSARERHTRSWQNILEQCGMMPTRDN